MATHITPLFYITVSIAFLVAPGICSEHLTSSLNEDVEPPAYLQSEVEASNDGEKDSHLLPPEPSPGFYKYLENCGRKLDLKCTDNIFITLLYRMDIDRYCCGELMEMGEKCHADYVQTLSRLDKYKDFQLVLPKRGQWLWGYCHKIGGQKKRNPPPPPPAGIGRKKPSSPNASQGPSPP